MDRDFANTKKIKELASNVMIHPYANMVNKNHFVRNVVVWAFVSMVNRNEIVSNVLDQRSVDIKNNDYHARIHSIFKLAYSACAERAEDLCFVK